MPRTNPELLVRAPSNAALITIAHPELILSHLNLLRVDFEERLTLPQTAVSTLQIGFPRRLTFGQTLLVL